MKLSVVEAGGTLLKPASGAPVAAPGDFWLGAQPSLAPGVGIDPAQVTAGGKAGPLDALPPGHRAAPSAAWAREART